ncbi:MAG: hypothetical protein ACK5LP_00270 [Campylobacteraceae bacterium]
MDGTHKIKLFYCLHVKTSIFKSIATLTLLFSLSYSQNNTSVDNSLISALKSNNTYEQNLTTQSGSLYYQALSAKSSGGFLAPSVKYKSSSIGFSGFGLIEQTYTPKFYENTDNTPAFMLMFKKQGNDIKFGGDIRGLDFKEWNEVLMNK